jgi:hypothetical protein
LPFDGIGHPLWVTSGNGVTPASCPFFPSKQTFAAESNKEKKKKKRGSKHKKDQSRLKEEPPEADSP